MSIKMEIKSYIVDKNGNRKSVKSKLIKDEYGIKKIVYGEDVLLTINDTLETELYFEESN